MVEDVAVTLPNAPLRRCSLTKILSSSFGSKGWGGILGGLPLSNRDYLGDLL